MLEENQSGGRLIYVVGPSGAGKDSILNGARSRLPVRAPLVFAHRYITRPVDAGGENHVALSQAEFALRRDRGLFALHWEGNGLFYGVGREVDAWMAAGLTVVVNGSREYLDEAARRYPSLLPLAVTVPSSVLRQRLVARGRETPERIEERLARAAAFSVSHPNLRIIRNDGPLDRAVDAFLALVLSEAVSCFP
jgi:ribose 1,5-bisphosphokinase